MAALQRLWGREDAKIESLSAGPQLVSRAFNLQRIADPIDEAGGAGAPELNFKLEFRDFVFQVCRVLLDVVARTDFLRTHALSIVDKENGDFGRAQQFPNLRLGRLLRLGCKSIVARLPNPMRLVADEGIDLAGRQHCGSC